MPNDSSVYVNEITSSRCLHRCVGPEHGADAAGERERLPQRAFPYLTASKCDDRQYSGSGAARDLRGELGWEIYAPWSTASNLWDHALGGRATARCLVRVPRYPSLCA